MGSSPSADLYWGYDLGDLTDPDTYESIGPQWLQDDGDADEALAKALGWVKVPFPDGAPEQNYTNRDYRAAEQDYRRAKEAFMATPQYQAWSDNLAEQRRIISPIPVELGRYGWSEEASLCVRVKASVQHAGDYGSIALKPLEVAPEWAEQLAEFMRLLELPIPAGVAPGWHMNCSYG